MFIILVLVVALVGLFLVGTYFLVRPDAAYRAYVNPLVDGPLTPVVEPGPEAAPAEASTPIW